MRWINRFFLAAVLLPRRLYARWGVDVPQLTAILTTKLTMDDRRPNTLQVTRQRQNQGNNKEISNSTIGTMFISGLMGLMYLFAFFAGEDYITRFTMYFSLFILMLSMMLVSDFTSVLIDVRDNFIILPKPVNDSTFVVARLLHVFIHISKLVLPMSLPCFIYLAIASNPLASLLFLFLTLLATLFSIFLINAVYLLILRVTTPERFKNAISYIQIAFAIIAYAGFQFLPRMSEHIDEGALLVLPDSPWLLLAPPYWFACAFNTLFTGEADMLSAVGTGFALVLPLLSIYGVARFLAPAFNQKLAMIGSGESGPRAGQQTSEWTAKKGLSDWLAGLLTTNPAERTGFQFAWKMMLRSREFKVKVYPAIGYLVVIVGALYLQNSKREHFAQEMFSGYRLLILIYVSSILLVGAINQMVYSEKFRASWIFYITPTERPGQVISGAFKAAIFQFYFFIALLAYVLAAILSSPLMLLNVTLALCNQLVICFTISGFNNRKLPFSQPTGIDQQGGQFVRRMALLVVSGLIALIHFLAFRHPVAIAVALAFSGAALWWLVRWIKNTDWATMEYTDA